MLSPYSRSRARLKTQGFSLIELMVALTIMGLLIALGIPSFVDWIRNIKIRSAAEAFTASLQIARTEAIKGNTTVFYQLTDTLTDACNVSTTGKNWVVSLCPTASKCGQVVNRAAVRKDYKCDANASDGTPLPLILGKGQLEGNGISQISILDGKTWQGLMCFSGLGRINPSANLCSGSALNPAGLTRFKITNGNNNDCVDQGGKIRCMQIDISAAGEIRLCDPAVTDSKDPRKC